MHRAAARARALQSRSRMRSLLVVVCLSSVGCYTVANTPGAHASARRLALAELAGAAVLVFAGAMNMQDDETVDTYTVHANNTAPVITILGGLALGAAGLMSASASNGN